METFYDPIFAIPLGVHYLNSTDKLYNTFDGLYNRMPSVVPENDNIAKKVEVATSYHGDQHRIRIIDDVNPVFYYKDKKIINEWEDEIWKTERSEFLLEIIELVKKFIKTVTYHPREFDYYIKDMWMVKLKEGDYNALHSHWGSCISGAYIQEVPDHIDFEKMHPDGKL